MAYEVKTIGAMGDASSMSLTDAPLDPAAFAVMLAAAKTLPDAKAEQLVELADATAYGARQRWMRIGLGAALGLAVGILGSRMLAGGRRR